MAELHWKDSDQSGRGFASDGRMMGEWRRDTLAWLVHATVHPTKGPSDFLGQYMTVDYAKAAIERALLKEGDTHADT